MNRPEFPADTFFVIGRVFRCFEGIVQPDEIKRRTDPGDTGNEVHPPSEDVQPVEDVSFHGYLSLFFSENANILYSGSIVVDRSHGRIPDAQQFRGDRDRDCGRFLALYPGYADRAN